MTVKKITTKLGSKFRGTCVGSKNMFKLVSDNNCHLGFRHYASLPTKFIQTNKKNKNKKKKDYDIVENSTKSDKNIPVRKILLKDLKKNPNLLEAAPKIMPKLEVFPTVVEGRPIDNLTVVEGKSQATVKGRQRYSTASEGKPSISKKNPYLKYNLA